MHSVDHEVDRCLTLIRNKIRECGSTQVEVQESLGWGCSYISQLFTKQKTLRVDQVLSILGVLGIDPGDFFRELYRYEAPSQGAARSEFAPPHAGTAELRRELGDLRALVHGLTKLFLETGIISDEELSAALPTVGADSRIGGF